MKNILALFLSLYASTLLAQDFEAMDAYFSKAQKDWGVPGYAIGIVKDGNLVFSKGYGTLKMGTQQGPDEQTLFAIASNSKAFTSMLIGMLVDEGKLKWTDKVRDYLPYFEMYDTYAGQNATIEDLLCHRLGLGTFSGDIVWYNSDFTSEEIIKRIKYIKPAYEFRDGYGYSNLMFITAGEVIKKVTGKTWYENIKERILDPLGMQRTFVNVEAVENAGNAAVPHRLEENERHIPIDYTSWEEIASTGGLFSSVEDLSKWMIFNMNHGVVGEDTLLSPASRNRIWNIHNSFITDRLEPNPYGTTFSGYGLGWGLRTYQGELRVGHTGGYDGMISSVNMLPNQKLGVVVLTNGLKAPINALAYYVFDQFLNREFTDWSQRDLDRNERSFESDDRLTKLRSKRVENTEPSHELDAYTGTYYTPVYGNIYVKKENNSLLIDFERSQPLMADLVHWHYDTFEMKFRKNHPWFTLGTVKFTTNNNQEVTGIEFEVPNNDFWFDELNAQKVD